MTTTRQLFAWTYGSMWTAAPGRLGTFQGHLIAATFFCGFSLAFFAMALSRSRRGVQFWGPEKNPLVLKRLGYTLLFATSLGNFWETYCVFTHPGHHLELGAIPHITMYSSYTFMAVVALLESRNKVQPDSWKKATCLALLVQTILWYDHAGHKALPEDKKMHYCISWVVFGTFLAACYMVYEPRSMEAHLATIAGIFLQFTWVITTGLYTCCIDISLHIIPSYLCLQFITIVAVITTVGVLFGGKVDPSGLNLRESDTMTLNSNMTGKHKFSRLTMSEEDLGDRHSLALDVY